MNMIVGFMQAIKPEKDGDIVDRLSYYYSVILLTVFAVFISGWSFVGAPIMCWFPAYYRPWWIQYALDYCYVQNTYFLPFTEEKSNNYWELGRDLIHIPKNITHREDRLIGYYQWVPFVLALVAICFYIPVMIWRGLYEASGIKVESICKVMCGADNMAAKARKTNVEKVSRFLDHAILMGDQLGGGSFLAGRYISLLYVFTKFLYALNCIGQFFLLQAFLGLDHFWWGASILGDLAGGREWIESSHFPRVTLCDFEVRVLGNLHRHTVQCVLMINMFNEKIFVFLWWWLMIIGAISVISFFYWLVTTLNERRAQMLIKSYLRKIDPMNAKSTRRRAMVHDFINDTLKADGVFLLRLIKSNAGDVVACELLEALWNNFKKRKSTDDWPNSKPPSAPSVRLAGSDPKVEYPTLPMATADYPYPPSYTASVDAPRQRAPTTAQSNL